MAFTSTDWQDTANALLLFWLSLIYDRKMHEARFSLSVLAGRMKYLGQTPNLALQNVLV